MSRVTRRRQTDLLAADATDEQVAWTERHEDERRQRAEHLFRLVREHHDGGPVVDVGSYPNLLTVEMHDALDAEVVGVDLDPSRASRAVRERLDLRQCDLDEERIPVGSEQAGVVVCSEVLEHLSRPERAVSEIARVLKPGGVALITTPNFGRLQTRLRALRGRPPHRLDAEVAEREEIGHDGHRQLLSTEEVRGLCEGAGMSIIDHRTLQFWSARSPVLDALYRVWPAARPYQLAVARWSEEVMG